MRKVVLLFVFSLIFFSCEKDPTTTGDGYNLQGNGIIKTKYIYSSSSENEPYALNSYTYDENWNLMKILISDNPKPVFASYTYEYSDKGVLINMKYKAINGENHLDQTESDFTLIREYKYSYLDNTKIELEYRKNELTDSVVYVNANNLLISENHYDLKDFTEWSITYQYDSNNNLIKKTDSPEGTYTIYSYEGSRIIKSENYDNTGALTVENELVYTKSEGKVIVETHYKGIYGDHVSEKSTYKDGNIIEYIRYHPTFQGAEWYCYRYDYY